MALLQYSFVKKVLISEFAMGTQDGTSSILSPTYKKMNWKSGKWSRIFSVLPISHTCEKYLSLKKKKPDNNADKVASLHAEKELNILDSIWHLENFYQDPASCCSYVAASLGGILNLGKEIMIRPSCKFSWNKRNKANKKKRFLRGKKKEK